MPGKRREVCLKGEEENSPWKKAMLSERGRPQPSQGKLQGNESKEREEITGEIERGDHVPLNLIPLKEGEASLPRAKLSCFLRSALSSDFFLFLEKVPPEYRGRGRRSG